MTVPIGVFHFSPLYWTDPEIFDPERLVSNFKIIYIITGFHPAEVGAHLPPPPLKRKEREKIKGEGREKRGRERGREGEGEREREREEGEWKA